MNRKPMARAATPGPSTIDIRRDANGISMLPHPAVDPAAELRAWAAAVQHLHASGLPAAAPAFVSAWLRRRGIYPDWTTAA